MKKIKLVFFSLLLFALAMPFNKLEAQSNTYFITTWKTDNPGTSNATSITIPTTVSSIYDNKGYNYDVSWKNDGTWETGFTGNATHDYNAAGTYTVAIRGAFPQINFSGTLDKEKIISIEQWGTNVWSSMSASFYGCNNLVGNATDVPNLTNVTDMSYMFAFASAFNQNIGNWNVSNVIYMSSMFYRATTFNQDIGNWNVSKVKWMSNMFAGAAAFNQDITNWNVSKVTNMDGMFAGASTFNQSIGNWNVSKVEGMSDMFGHTDAFNQNIGSWNVSNVNRMTGMFGFATAFNQDIGNWDVGNVTQMGAMFDGADKFNQNIGNWNVGKVINMTYMFAYANSFDQNLGNWDVSSVTSISSMFSRMALSTANYDALLIGWSSRTLHRNLLFDGGDSKFCNGETARTYIKNTFGWNIFDGGKSATCVVPITLIDFKAIANKSDHSVLLTWATLSESNNDYFTIERSKDGVVFEGINNIPSAGNSNSRVDYEATDTHPLEGYSYYRLKQTDKDGKFTYSQIEKVYFGSQSFFATVSPNPTRNVVQLKIDGVIKKGLKYSVTDMIGKKLANGIINTNTTSIDLGNRAQGTYILQVIDEGKLVQTFKIIKTN